MSSPVDVSHREESKAQKTGTYSVASVTVAYNGSSILPRQIDALKKQTRKLDEIVVVDNASSDDTLKLLAAQYPEVTVISLPQNIGVGGGYSSGLSRTVEKHDWIWLLDGDSIPQPDGLEKLLGALDHLGSDAERISILAPLCINAETGHVYPALMWKNGWHYEDGKKLVGPAVFVDSVISSGTLLKSDAAKKVGFPRSDFFIDFVDHEYCFRLRRAGYSIAMIPASRLDHSIGEFRNRDFMGLHKRWIDHAPWREYYMARNEIFTIWEYHPDWRSKSSTIGRLLRRTLEILLFRREKAARFRMIAQGVRDGFAGRLGIRHLPEGREWSQG